MKGEGYSILNKKTRYGESVFRSKLEAKWAVFMDLLNVAYEYEPRLEKVETVCNEFYYKPDFYIPNLKYYIEFKPREPTKSELIKAAGWANSIEDIVIIFRFGPYAGHLMQTSHDKPILSRNRIFWSQCPRCLQIELKDGGELSCGCYSQDEILGSCENIDFVRTPNLLKAYKIASKHDFSINKRVTALQQRPSL